jgi:hypothetical protein
LSTSFLLDPIVIPVTQLSNSLIYVLPKWGSTFLSYT